MPTITSALEVPPLERATDRLERSAGAAQDGFDDLGAPGWDAFRRSRARFLDRAAASTPAGSQIGLPTDPRDGG
jgi:hypothetical protein